MKAAHALRGSSRYLLSPGPAAWEWIPTLGTAGAAAILYFLAARLGLALLSAHSDVAVFWPASGIAAGILIVLGRRALPAVVVGVVVGTIAADLMSDRSFLTSLLNGFCNAGEAVLAAWLLERWFGRPFTFGELRRIGGFLAAAGLAAATSAIGGAATMTLLHAAAPYWDVWRAWFLADGVGIVVVAPLIIGLSQVWRELPSRAESVEGVGVLTLLALISLYVVDHPTGSWLSFDPDVVALPPLLWLTARCQPTFGIAGAFVVSITVIWATTFGVGHFGNGGLPLIERVNGARVVITMVTVYTLVLAALFAQRKKAEEGLNILNAELDHRVKNVLATVGAIIFQTQNANASIADYVASVDRRIKSLASTHELLSHNRWHGASLLELIRREVAPYTTGNTDTSGPSITLKPEAAQATSMVLHELATNAAKYGALSNHSGRVSVRWFWLPNGNSHRRLAIEWQEIGGPSVSAPSGSGYGTSIIRELLSYELGGTAELAFAPGGVHCRLEVPADWVSNDGEPPTPAKTLSSITLVLLRR